MLAFRTLYFYRRNILAPDFFLFSHLSSGEFFFENEYKARRAFNAPPFSVRGGGCALSSPRKKNKRQNSRTHGQKNRITFLHPPSPAFPKNKCPNPVLFPERAYTRFFLITSKPIPALPMVVFRSRDPWPKESVTWSKERQRAGGGSSSFFLFYMA